MSESVKRITIDALPVSSAVKDEDIFIKSNQVETSKVTAKAITEYIKENLDIETLDIVANTQPDWNETDTSSAAYVKNKPTAMVANGGNADTVNNHTVESDVPANAEFTDTVYTHPDSSVTPGTYKSVTVDKQGHVTGGSNPTTLSEYGIADAATKAQGEKADTAVQSVKIGNTEYKSGTIAVLPDYPTALPASDVYEWAKAETKPVYTASEVGADESGAASTAYKNAKTYTDDRIADLINGAPATLDTLGEIAQAMATNEDVVEKIQAQISNLTAYPSNIAVQVHYGTTEMYTDGYYKIKFANNYNWMLSCMVMLYQNYQASVILVSGYAYFLNGSHWYGQNAALVAASPSIDTMLVKFGYDADNLPWFAVPSGNYTGLTICNINNGYQQMPDWSKMITIEYVQTLSGTIETEITASAPVKSATIRNVEKVSSLPSNAASNPNTLYVIPG